MPSSNWESCVVNRSVNEIPTRPSKKVSYSSSQSERSRPVSKSRSSLLRNASYAGSINTSTTGYSSGSPWSSRAPSPVDSEYSGEKGHNTLVPIDPFIANGHAHTFASFETNLIENKRLQHRSACNNFLQLRDRKHQQSLVSSKSCWSKVKRRGSSIDSDSLSSSSGDSRPISPNSSLNSWEQTCPSNPKKVRKIFVSAETLSHIVDNNNSFEITEVGKPTTVAERLIVESQSTKKNSSLDFDESYFLPDSTASPVTHMPKDKDPVESGDRLELSLDKGKALTASQIDAINAAIASNSAIVIKPSNDQKL